MTKYNNRSKSNRQDRKRKTGKDENQSNLQLGYMQL